MSTTGETIHHPDKTIAIDTLAIPISLLEKMSEAVELFVAFQDELEDYLLSQDAAFLARMRQAQAHHREGKTRSLESLKQELCIE
jgi:hypothetical protein